MSTIKSSDEHLTLNADGSSKDIKFQANGVEKASLSSAGAFTSKSLVVNGTNADLTLAASGNNISFARNSDNYITASGGSSSNLILDGQNRIVLKHNGTEKLRVTTNGLTFNGDTAAANALNDYEEGTWQPSYTTSSGSITAHPTYSLCRYTKIGRVVQIQGLVSTSAVSSPSGSVKMYGLPFTVDNNTSGEDSGAAAIAVANIVDFASSLHMLTINPQTGGTYLNLTEFNGTSTNSNIANRWQVDTYFRFSGTYTTN